MIFVFGSNLAGIHGAGAARTALNYHGAVWGQAEGLAGNSYAIPTKDRDVKTSLSLAQVKDHVDTFLIYAQIMSTLGFQITCIGCGLAGFKDEEIAPLFRDAPPNCFFDTKWRPIFLKLGKQFEYWGTF